MVSQCSAPPAFELFPRLAFHAQQTCLLGGACFTQMEELVDVVLRNLAGLHVVGEKS